MLVINFINKLYINLILKEFFNIIINILIIKIVKIN